MRPEVPLINGKAYDYASVVMNVLGSEIKDVTEINYTDSQEKSNNYGTGRYPTSRGRGAIETNGSLSLAMDAVEALREVALNGKLVNIPPFDITVTYLVAGKTVRHIIKDVEFNDDGVETSQGDTQIVRSFGITFSMFKPR